MKHAVIKRRTAPLLLAALTLCLLLAAFTFHTSAQASEPALTLAVTENSGDAANDLTVVYGDSVTLTATLTDTDLPEGTEISFCLDALSASVPTDADGKAVWVIDSLALTAQSSYTVDATCGALSDTATLTVSQRPITYEGMTVADKEYDGSNDVVIKSYGTLTGVLEGDSITVDASFKFADQDVGQNKTILLKDCTLQGSKRLNYTFLSPTLTASITPRKVTIKGIVATPFDYNGLQGQEVEIGDGYYLSGILESEADAAYLSGIRATVLSPNASNAQGIVFDPAVTYLTGDLSANYELVLPTDVTVRINRVKLTLSVDGVTINKGQSIPTLTAKVRGFVNGESSSELDGFALPTVVVPDGINTLNTALSSFTVSYMGGEPTGNYEFDYTGNTEVALEIHTVAADSSFYSVSVEDLSIWHNALITVTPSGAYEALTTQKTDGSLSLDSIEFISSLALSEQGERQITFSLRHSDGTVTEPVTLTYKLDTVLPTGDVTWKGQSIVTNGVASYRYFSKAAIALGFTADDGEHSSGVQKTEYALSAQGPFTELTENALQIATAPGLYTVWLRITDRAGNTTLLQTDGMVLYADATAANTSLFYERLSLLEQSLAITLADNLPATLIGPDGAQLTAGEHFTINGQGQLTLKADYLDTLVAGDHSFALSIHPLGHPFVSNTVNDAPTPLTLTLTVTRRAPTAADLTLSLPANTVYDGGDKTVTVSAPNGMGTILQIYYVDASGTPHAAAQNAGTYVIKIDLDTGADYMAVTDLIIGEMTVSKMTPAAPTVTYSTVTGMLSGQLQGLVYAVNGGVYLPLPTDFSSVVQDACTLSFYLPGDGQNTLDSEIAVITVTRGTAPTVTPTAETLFAACDGSITSGTSGIEYRHMGETAWRTVTGLTVTDLAPGTYEVRTAAVGTALASPAVTVTVLPAPEFLTLQKQTQIDAQPAVTLTGDLTALAELSMVALTADPTSPSAIRSLSAIDQRTTQVIGFFDLTLAGRHSGALTLEIAVGDAYNGQNLTVHLEKSDGTVKMLSAPCENGILTLTVDTLSPILITTPMTTPHGVGSAAWIFMLAVIAVLAIGTCVTVEILIRRKKKQ